MAPDKNVQDNFSNLTSIKDLKAAYITKLGDKGTGLKVENLRFFCLGKEL
jgi:hypothetical protein